MDIRIFGEILGMVAAVATIVGVVFGIVQARRSHSDARSARVGGAGISEAHDREVEHIADRMSKAWGLPATPQIKGNVKVVSRRSGFQPTRGGGFHTYDEQMEGDGIVE